MVQTPVLPRTVSNAFSRPETGHDSIQRTTHTASHLSEEEAMRQASLLKVFADATRLRIINILLHHEGAVCVYELTESFSLEQPTISHHLRILRDAGVIACRKKGLYAYYYVNRRKVEDAQAHLTGLFPSPPASRSSRA